MIIDLQHYHVFNLYVTCPIFLTVRPLLINHGVSGNRLQALVEPQNAQEHECQPIRRLSRTSEPKVAERHAYR